jgi:hypothetical protein
MLSPFLEIVVLISPIEFNSLYWKKLYKISKAVNWWYELYDFSDSILYTSKKYILGDGGLYRTCFEGRIIIYGVEIPSTVNITLYYDGVEKISINHTITDFVNVLKNNNYNCFRTKLKVSLLSQFIPIVNSYNILILKEMRESVTGLITGDYSGLLSVW